ncbi:MAG: GNAT family N-acetyltransferase [Nitrospira sp.]
MLYAGPARDQNEAECAVALAGQVFDQATGNVSSAVERKHFQIREHPGAGKDSVIVVSLDGKGVIGTTFLIDRVFPRGQTSIRGTFLSSFCVDPSLRAQGYSRILMAAALQACSTRSAAIALVIARRAVDRFYNKFGFWGLSQYSKLTVEAAALDEISVAGFRLRRALPADIPQCNDKYAFAYKDSFGHCVRDRQTWEYILKKCVYLCVQVSVIEKESVIIGYAVHDESGNIHEIGVGSTGDARITLALLSRSAAAKLLTVHIPPIHPAVRALEGFDVTLATRECPFGGHMVKVIDPMQLVDAAVCRIEQLARSRNLASGSENADGVCLTWDGEKAGVFLHSHMDSVASVARLLGVARVSSTCRPLTFDPPVSFNIPLVDQI